MTVEHVGCCIVQLRTLFECTERVLVQCAKALHEGSLLESKVNELQKKLAAGVPVAWGEAAGEKVASSKAHKLTPSEHLQKATHAELEDYQKAAITPRRALRVSLNSCTISLLEVQ